MRPLLRRNMFSIGTGLKIDKFKIAIVSVMVNTNFTDNLKDKRDFYSPDSIINVLVEGMLVYYFQFRTILDHYFFKVYKTLEGHGSDFLQCSIMNKFCNFKVIFYTFLTLFSEQTHSNSDMTRLVKDDNPLNSPVSIFEMFVPVKSSFKRVSLTK